LKDAVLRTHPVSLEKRADCAVAAPGDRDNSDQCSRRLVARTDDLADRSVRCTRKGVFYIGSYVDQRATLCGADLLFREAEIGLGAPWHQ
jgi:hypothetical protein